MDYKKGMILFRKKIGELVDDAELVDSICAVYEQIYSYAREERKLRQQEGIQKAREEGRTLGRPRIEEPDNFPAIMSAWEKRRINAAEAAQMCGIGVSTFYRRVKDLKDKRRSEGRG